MRECGRESAVKRRERVGSGEKSGEGVGAGLNASSRRKERRVDGSLSHAMQSSVEVRTRMEEGDVVEGRERRQSLTRAQEEDAWEPLCGVCLCVRDPPDAFDVLNFGASHAPAALPALPRRCRLSPPRCSWAFSHQDFAMRPPLPLPPLNPDMFGLVRVASPSRLQYDYRCCLEFLLLVSVVRSVPTAAPQRPSFGEKVRTGMRPVSLSLAFVWTF